MFPKLVPGIEKSLETTVAAGMLATAYCSGTLDVLATPSMIALMEQTALESVEPVLPEGMTTVGTEVRVKHLRATPIGKWITCHSVLESVNGRELTFSVTASDETGVIGTGTHIRFIVDIQRFLDKIS